MWNNACEYPDHPLLQKEMRQLMLLNNNKLDHPIGASKDIWDAISICVNLLVQHASRGKALDIDLGEGPTAPEENEAKLYEETLLKFSKRYDRVPRDHKEMSIFMQEEMAIKKSPEEIGIMREAWEIEQPLQERNVLGLNGHTEFMGFSRGTDNLGLDTDFGLGPGDLPDSEDIGF